MPGVLQWAAAVLLLPGAAALERLTTFHWKPGASKRLCPAECAACPAPGPWTAEAADCSADMDFCISKTATQQGGCWGAGYSDAGYLVQAGALESSTGAAVPGYAVSPRSIPAALFAASASEVYYRFKTKEDHVIYTWGSNGFSQAARIPAASITVGVHVGTKQYVHGNRTGPITLLFAPANFSTSRWPRVGPSVEGALLHDAGGVTVTARRFDAPAGATPFDPTTDFADGPCCNTHGTRQRYFPFLYADGAEGVLWQDARDLRIYHSRFAANLSGATHSAAPTWSGGEVLAAAADNGKGVLVYLLWESAPPADRTQTAAGRAVKLDANTGTDLVVRQLDTTALHTWEVAEWQAAMEWSPERCEVGIELGYRHTVGLDGVNQQGCQLLVMDTEQLSNISSLGTVTSGCWSNSIQLSGSGDFLALDAGSAPPRQLTMHSFNSSTKASKAAYAYKTLHMNQSYTSAYGTAGCAACDQLYTAMSDPTCPGSGKCFYRWSEDSSTYTEQGRPGLIEVPGGVLAFFAGERDGMDGLDNTRTGRWEDRGTPRQLGFVKVSSCSPAQCGARVLSPGGAHSGEYYGQDGVLRMQRNEGVNWLTSYPSNATENVSRLKTVRAGGRNALVWEVWGKDKWLRTATMTVDDSGAPSTPILDLEQGFMIPPSDVLVVRKGKIVAYSGAAPGTESPVSAAVTGTTPKLVRIEIAIPGAGAGDGPAPDDGALNPVPSLGRCPAGPTSAPSGAPTAPTGPPSRAPQAPSQAPSRAPLSWPTRAPMVAAAVMPTFAPMYSHGGSSTSAPRAVLTHSPVGGPAPPSRHPVGPTFLPTATPSASPAPPWRPPSGGPLAPPSPFTRAPNASALTNYSQRPSLPPSAAPSPPSLAPTQPPSPAPSAAPAAPSPSPSATPSAQPSPLPSAQPSVPPSSQPSASPSAGPSALPSAPPSSLPSGLPSAAPSAAPSGTPTGSPSPAPSQPPSQSPSSSPSDVPTAPPSEAPSSAPSELPSRPPSNLPSAPPTEIPTEAPEQAPTAAPSRLPSATAPSQPPTAPPVWPPTVPPTSAPSASPQRPTLSPSGAPSPPTSAPTKTTAAPVLPPTVAPSIHPASGQPTGGPSTAAPTPAPFSSAPSAAPAPALDECAAPGTCGPAQRCTDPNPTVASLYDFRCTCSAPAPGGRLGSAQGTRARCSVDECLERPCGPQQICTDPNRTALSSSQTAAAAGHADFRCTCPDGSATRTGGPADCGGSTAELCAAVRCGPGQACHAGICVCAAPYFGSMPGGPAQCEFDECRLGSVAVCGGGQECADPNTRTMGDYVCSCLPPHQGTAVGHRAGCAKSDCAGSPCGSDQLCKDPNATEYGGFVCECRDGSSFAIGRPAVCDPVAPALLSAAEADAPAERTDSGSSPWLWAFVALASVTALCVVAMAFLWRRKATGLRVSAFQEISAASGAAAPEQELSQHRSHTGLSATLGDTAGLRAAAGRRSAESTPPRAASRASLLPQPTAGGELDFDPLLPSLALPVGGAGSLPASRRGSDATSDSRRGSAVRSGAGDYFTSPPADPLAASGPRSAASASGLDPGDLLAALSPPAAPAGAPPAAAAGASPGNRSGRRVTRTSSAEPAWRAGSAALSPAQSALRRPGAPPRGRETHGGLSRHSNLSASRRPTTGVASPPGGARTESSAGSAGGPTSRTASGLPASRSSTGRDPAKPVFSI